MGAEQLHNCFGYYHMRLHLIANCLKVGDYTYATGFQQRWARFDMF